MDVIDARETARRLAYPSLIAALRVAFRDGGTVPSRHHHTIAMAGADPATLLLMPAWTHAAPLPPAVNEEEPAHATSTDRGGQMVVKVVTVFPDNGLRGLPSVMGSVLLLCRDTGRPLLVIDGGELTARRTAAASALAVDLIARSDADHLLIVGTGRVAEELALAHAHVRPLRRITVWGRTPARVDALVARLRTRWSRGPDAGTLSAFPSPRIEGEADLRRAVSGASIVSCATLSRQPLVLGEWLSPGTHLDLVGAFTPTMRETDSAAVARSRVFVDTRDEALREGGDLIRAIEEGTFTPADVVADLHELCRAPSPGRGDPTAVTLFKSVGTALEDLAAAGAVYRAGDDLA